MVTLWFMAQQKRSKSEYICPMAAHKHGYTRLTHGGSSYAVASSLDRHSNRWLNLCFQLLNETNEFLFFFFFCAPLWLRGLCAFKKCCRLLWLTGFSQLALNGMKWCRKWARWKGLGGETVSAYHLPVALECSHGNRKWEASVQDGDQLVNGCIPQRQGVPGEEGRVSVFTLKEGTI